MGESKFYSVGELDPGREVSPTLTVTSVAGTETGYTAVTVTPALQSGHEYRWEPVSAEDQEAMGGVTKNHWTPEVQDVPEEDWADYDAMYTWDGTSEIDYPSHSSSTELNIYEIDPESHEVKAWGTCTAVVKD